MQLMPSVQLQFGVTNPYDPKQNVEAGTAYLRDLLLKYNGDVAAALARATEGDEA
jgi:soluble lytic murein transglycosylase-like protein